jgi:hypothetical protein
MQNTDLLVKSGASRDLVADDSDLTGPLNQTRVQQRLSEKMHILVKGAPYRVTSKSAQLGTTPGANQPLNDEDAFPRAMKAEKAFKAAIRQGMNDRDGVYKSMAPEFASRFGAFLANSPQNAQMAQWVGNLQEQVNSALSGIGKSITLTSPNTTGLVPYNLVAPTRLIYPVTIN